ncbi:MAG: V-type ATP synthase subunit F [Euryarchaeota archaeon CG01_land_8_20_14_3_00_38_12]|nr:MAG: V-type ATP synthase subunit F [Euryarchaeota archaeon CG01_land_8_20_14_3_00_38_12]PJB21867.1 MAG: V-type ATP synthase subunit F [Euryarchaeota archaeon CG_4_9_14_3_um_filter_38_12]
MKICVIGDRDTVIGFALSGVKNRITPKDKKEAENALAKFMEDPGIGVIIITEKLAEMLRKEINTWKTRKSLYPVIVEIPDKKGVMEREDRIEKIIRRAVGVVPEELRG